MRKSRRIIACGQSDIGLRRTSNEDAWRADITAGFFLVADGMGGAAAGEVASGLFVRTANRILSPGPVCSGSLTVSRVENVFAEAHRTIRAHVQQHPHCSGMGCTADLLVVHDTGFVLGHVGDSRTYLFRAGRLELLTHDHTLVQQQVEQGIISPSEAREHRMRNVILRAVGAGGVPEVDIIRRALAVGDLFLLCTDGFSDMVEDEQIRAIVAGPETLQEKASRCISEARRCGGRDNITVVLMEIE